MANINIKRKNGTLVAKKRSVSVKTANGRWRFTGGKRPEKTFDNASLDDMIAASRIVYAYKDGSVMEEKLGTDKAKSIAAHIIAPEPKEDTVKAISPHQLNEAIIQRNKRENKPTEKVIEIYKNMVAEE